MRSTAQQPNRTPSPPIEPQQISINASVTNANSLTSLLPFDSDDTPEGGTGGGDGDTAGEGLEEKS